MKKNLWRKRREAKRSKKRSMTKKNKKKK